MKPLQKQSPGLQQIYTNKYQLQQHKRKLHKIYESRKSQLCYDSVRASQFESLKETKIKSFANKFNKNSLAIAKNNIKLLTKLESVKSNLGRTADDQTRAHSFVTPFVKKRMLQTEKENCRISDRMKNMSSSLSQKKFVEDYAKSQKIKNRIMRYTTESSGVCLKSIKFMEREHSASALTYKVNVSPKVQKQKEPRKTVSKPILPKSSPSYYRREDILRNRVDEKDSFPSMKMRIKFRQGDRLGNPEQQRDESQEDNILFSTQPKKYNVRSLKTNY